MKSYKILAILIFISSCGGGGGGGGSPAIPFVLTLASSVFTTDEDIILNGSIAASANENVTLNYSLQSSTSNGSLTFSDTSGSITYIPNENFNGQDQFTYSVTAVEKNITRSATVTITITPVNDAPQVSMDSKDNLNENNLLFDQNPTYAITYSDVDNSDEELNFSAKVNRVEVPSTFISTGSGKGNISIDLTSLSNAGLFNADIIVSDGDLTGSDTYSTWHISNKTTVTINQDDNPEDGFNGGAKTQKDYYVYYLIGNPSSIGRTKYLFIGDSLNGDIDLNLYRRALVASINKLNSSDASEFFSDNYFTVVSAEPVDPDGSSPVGVRTGCYDFDEDVYCIGQMDTAIFDVLLPDNVLVSTLTRIEGRGVNQGYKNIQRIREDDPERTRHTLMHELGHAHGNMGDEYRSDERDLTDPGYKVNATTQADIYALKWKHHIDDMQNVLGKDIQVCYNLPDGTIADWDELGINVEDCECFVNEWDANGNFVRKNPECSGVGHFEGNYYGLNDNYRPTFCSVMDKCTSGGYGKVNVEGFAIGSLENQGFYRGNEGAMVKGDSNANIGFEFSMDVEYDTSKITLKWYINGVEDTSKQDLKTVVFDRPSDDSVEIYTAKAIDLTGTITAPDDILNNNDFYEGAFQSSFYWCAYVSGECNWSYDPDPSRYNQYDWGFMRGPIGVTYGINWEKW